MTVEPLVVLLTAPALVAAWDPSGVVDVTGSRFASQASHIFGSRGARRATDRDRGRLRIDGVTLRAARPLLVVACVLALGVALPWAALAASQTVTIQEFSFAPMSVTVNAGDSVTWRNTGGEGHTATSNNPGFDPGLLNPGASKTIVFGTAGTFDYHCAIHPSMHGTVTVVAAVVTTPPPTPPPTVAPTPPPTIAPTAPPTPAPTVAPTVAPTSAPTTTAPASSAPAASATQTAVASATPSAAPTATVIAAASPSATPPPSAAPAGDAGPLPLIAGVVVLAGIAGLALYGLRRR